MKKVIFFLASICCALQAFAQLDSTTHWRLDLAQGSFHNKYFYPITDVRFIHRTPLKHFNADVRLRSYGILSVFSHRAYDIDLLLDYSITHYKHMNIYFGAGPEVSLRLVHDARSNATSGVEMVAMSGFRRNFGKFAVDVPLRFVFYADGMSASVWPEASYLIRKRVSLFLRYENDMLYYYSGVSHEWHFNSFIGVHIYR